MKLSHSSDGAPRVVLLALDDRDCARYCLERAFDLACALDAVLHVVRVLPAWRWLWRPFPRLRARARERARVALRTTHFWLAGAYGAEPRAGQVVVRSGGFQQQVCEHAKTRSVALIVIPSHLSGVGRVATALALATRCRVIISREPGRSRTILAASDLCTPGFPVLDQAAKLGASLRAPLVPFHNVDPLSLTDQLMGAAGAGGALRPSAVLEQAARGVAPDSAPALRAQIDPVSAIVEEARARRADLVMVGAHARPRLERLIHGSVAARVVASASCSVMVTPLAAPAPP